MNIVERLEASRKLPIGHYERRAAQEAVRAEYARCGEVEKPYRNLYLTAEAAKVLVNRICLEMRILKYPIIRIEDTGLAGGFQRGKELCFPYEPIPLATVLHELTHYVIWREWIPTRGELHGTVFVEWLKFVCAVYEQVGN